MSCNHMRYYFDLILLAAVWFVRSGQSYVVALYPVVSYFTPTFKGWHPSSSLPRRTNTCVHANKEKTVWQLVWAFSFLLFTSSKLLGWLWQLMDRFWVPTIFFRFLLFSAGSVQLLTANFASPTTMKRTSYRHEFRSMFIFFISTSWCN